MGSGMMQLGEFKVAVMALYSKQKDGAGSPTAFNEDNYSRFCTMKGIDPKLPNGVSQETFADFIAFHDSRTWTETTFQKYDVSGSGTLTFDELIALGHTEYGKIEALQGSDSPLPTLAWSTRRRSEFLKEYSSDATVGFTFEQFMFLDHKMLQYAKKKAWQNTLVGKVKRQYTEGWGLQYERLFHKNLQASADPVAKALHL